MREGGGWGGGVEKWLWNDGTSKATLREKRDNAVYFGCQRTKGSGTRLTQTNKFAFDKATATTFAFYTKPALFPASSSSWLATFVEKPFAKLPSTNKWAFFFCCRCFFFFKRRSVGGSTRNFYLESCRFKGKASRSAIYAWKKKKSSCPFYISPALIFLLLLF